MKNRKNNLAITLFMILGLVCTLSSCKEEDNGTKPVIETGTVSNINIVTAASGGTITLEGSSEVTQRGVCWSKTANPTIKDSLTKDAAGTGEFSSILTGLEPNSTYYVRAYATNKSGTAYGLQVIYKTPVVEILTDIDGNKYNTVKIGTQVWMVENLKTTKYRDGTSIPNITDDNQWTSTTSGAYCNYNNDISIATTYGRLYNWYSVNSSHMIAPQGWHVPSDVEWQILIDFLGGDDVAGGKMKEAGNSHWLNPNIDATNESGFTALPAGHRDVNAYFRWIETYAIWWSSSEETSGVYAWRRSVDYDMNRISRNRSYENLGLSIRCIKN